MYTCMYMNVHACVHSKVYVCYIRDFIVSRVLIERFNCMHATFDIIIEHAELTCW